jgi:branched-chain amino acid transport system permease protein
MTDLLSFTIVGLFTGAAYAIAASGLVLVYATTKVFNLAHGAMGMVMAFTFWQLSVGEGLPPWLALLLVVLVIAPAFGLLVERVLMRGLGEAPVSVSLVVTVGLFVGLIGLAQTVWPPDARFVDPFFGAAEVVDPSGPHCDHAATAA